MANALMANVPPINGLYVAFFSVMIYVLFGTSNHLSLGTHGVISLMVGSVVARYDGVLYPSEAATTSNGNLTVGTQTNKSSEYLSTDRDEGRVMIAMSLGFLVGIIQVNRFFVSDFLSL